MVFGIAINNNDEELDITMLLDVCCSDAIYVMQWLRMNGVPLMGLLAYM